MNNNNIYETFIAKSRYARYLDAEKRRENWPETVSRYFDAYCATVHPFGQS